MSEMTAMVCGECGVTFDLPTALVEQRKRDHQTFYCPNGHSRYFPGKTPEQKRIERLTTERDSYEEWVHDLQESLKSERKAHAITKGKLTKALHRVESLSGGDAE